MRRLVVREREYYLQLPANYDSSNALPVIFEGPGCGGKGNNLYALPDLATAVIRVGLSPSAEASAFTDRPRPELLRLR